MDAHQALMLKREEVTRRLQALQRLAEAHGVSAEFAEVLLSVRTLLILAPWQDNGLMTLQNAEARLDQLEHALERRLHAA